MFGVEGREGYPQRVLHTAPDSPPPLPRKLRKGGSTVPRLTSKVRRLGFVTFPKNVGKSKKKSQNLTRGGKVSVAEYIGILSL